MRPLAEVLQVRQGHQAVQVHQTLLGLGQQDDVPALADGTALESPVQVPVGVESQRLRLAEHPRQAQGCGGSVVHRAVRVLEAHAQLLAQGAQLVGFRVRIELARQGQRVEHRRVEFHSQPGQLRPQHRPVEGGVVRRDRAVPDKRHQLGNRGLRALLVGHHVVGDVRQFDDLLRDGHVRVHEHREGIGHVLSHQPHGADLDDPADPRVEAGGLEVQDHDRALGGPLVRLLHGVAFVDQIALAARNQLDLVRRGRREGRRERLQDAVVGDGHRGVAPLRGALDQLLRRRQRVHRGHVGVHVQFHALHGRLVLPDVLVHGHQVAHGHAQFVREIVEGALAAYAHMHAHGQLVHLLLDGLLLLLGHRRELLVFLRLAEALPVGQKALAEHRRGVVRHGEGHQQRLAAAQLPRLQLHDVALHHHDAAVLGQLPDRHGLVRDGPPEDRLAGLGLFLLPLAALRGLGLAALGAQVFEADGLRQPMADLLAQLPDPPLLVPGHRELHLQGNAKNIHDRLPQALADAVARHIVHGETVREGQRHAPVLAAPVDLVHPGHGARIVALQEILQHLPVAVDMRAKILRQRGAHDPQRQRLSRKEPHQQRLHLQEGLLLHQRPRAEGQIDFILAAYINHLRGVQLVPQVGECLIDLFHQVFIAHGVCSSGAYRP